MSSDLNNNSLEVMMVQLNKAKRQITKSSEMIT